MRVPEDLLFELDDRAASDPVVMAVVVTPNGLLRFMAEPQVVVYTLVVKGFRTFGEGLGANAVGPANPGSSPTW